MKKVGVFIETQCTCIWLIFAAKCLFYFTSNICAIYVTFSVTFALVGWIISLLYQVRNSPSVRGNNKYSLYQFSYVAQ